MSLRTVVFELRCFEFMGTRRSIAFCYSESFSIALVA